MKLPFPRSRRGIALVATAVVVLIGALALGGKMTGEGAAGKSESKAVAARPALTVHRHSPQRVDWPQTVAANGNIAAWQEAIIGTEAIGLRLTEVLVNVGDAVKTRPGAGHLRARHRAGRPGAGARRRWPRPRPRSPRPGQRRARARAAGPAALSARSRSTSTSPPSAPRRRGSTRSARSARRKQLRLRADARARARRRRDLGAQRHRRRGAAGRARSCSA